MALKFLEDQKMKMFRTCFSRFPASLFRRCRENLDVDERTIGSLVSVRDGDTESVETSLTQEDLEMIPAAPSSSSDDSQATVNPDDEGRKVAMYPNRPRAGTSTEKLEIPVSNDLKDFQFVEENNRTQNIKWRPLRGESLSVRSSDYGRSRQKVPSPGELYECIKVDFVHSPYRLANMSSRVELPEVYFQDNDKPKTWDAPDIFVISMSMPRDPSAGKEDGPSYTTTMYFQMKQATREILARITADEYDGSMDDAASYPLVNAIRLFNEWCRRAPTDPEFQGRFKMITAIQNIRELGLPSWITRWNGKPVLIKRAGQTGFIYKQENCMEMEISFHPFPWATKQAIQYLREQMFHKLLLTYGFVIEGRTHAELPEVLIGLCQLCFPKSEHAVPVNEFFSNDVVRLQSIHSGEYDSEDMSDGEGWESET